MIVVTDSEAVEILTGASLESDEIKICVEAPTEAIMGLLIVGVF